MVVFIGCYHRGGMHAYVYLMWIGHIDIKIHLSIISLPFALHVLCIHNLIRSNNFNQTCANSYSRGWEVGLMVGLGVWWVGSVVGVGVDAEVRVCWGVGCSNINMLPGQHNKSHIIKMRRYLLYRWGIWRWNEVFILQWDLEILFMY